MKKLAISLTALLLVLSLAACGSTEQKPTSDGLNLEGAAAVPEGADVTGDTLYGKITGIVGNELEIALAQTPEGGDTSHSGGGDSEGLTEMGGLVPADSYDPADNVDPNMEYTGETISVTIPAGTKVFGARQEIELSSLKKGDVVSLIVDPENHSIVRLVTKVS